MKQKLIAAALVLMLCSSCATIVSGSKQTVKFASNPTAATVYINEVEAGKTPFEIKLARKKSHDILIKLDGYQPYQTKLTKKLNGWYFGNILVGGFIGLILDPITGAMYNLTPKEMNAELTKSTAFQYKKGDVIVAVALEIDPSWKKVGQLEKAAN